MAFLDRSRHIEEMPTFSERLPDFLEISRERIAPEVLICDRFLSLVKKSSEILRCKSSPGQRESCGRAVWNDDLSDLSSGIREVFPLKTHRVINSIYPS